MDRRSFFASALATGALGQLGDLRAQDDDKIPDVEDAVERGLQHLKKIQAPDGHWEAPGGNYPTSVTAVCIFSRAPPRPSRRTSPIFVMRLSR